MGDKSYTVILPKAPLPVERIEYRKAKVGEIYFSSLGGQWQVTRANTLDKILVAIPARPWYPDGWLDDAGDPLEGVREVIKGKWLPCEPDDIILALSNEDRKNKNGPISHYSCGENFSRAGIVAIRIIKTSS